MEDLNAVDSVNDTDTWLARNQELLLNYAISVVMAIAIVVIDMIVARIVSNIINHLMVVRKVDAAVVDFLSILVCYGIITFTLIAALGCVGTQTVSVTAALDVVDLTVGPALQGPLSNLAAGVLLVVLRPFRAGEYVDLGGVVGTVLNVQVFSATMCTVGGKIVVIPNGKIIAGNTINFSREPVRRDKFIIGVTYDSDIDQVKRILTDTVQSDEHILEGREMTMCLNELSASLVNFMVRVWNSNSDLQSVYRDVLEHIKCGPDADGISFPCPQMDANFKCVKESVTE